MAIDYASLLAMQLGGNMVQQYLIALGTFLTAWIVLYIFRVIIVNRLEALSKKTKTDTVMSSSISSSRLDGLFISL